jgi:hypothetical protein
LSKKIAFPSAAISGSGRAAAAVSARGCPPRSASAGAALDVASFPARATATSAATPVAGASATIRARFFMSILQVEARRNAGRLTRTEPQ